MLYCNYLSFILDFFPFLNLLLHVLLIAGCKFGFRKHTISPKFTYPRKCKNFPFDANFIFLAVKFPIYLWAWYVFIIMYWIFNWFFNVQGYINEKLGPDEKIPWISFSLVMLYNLFLRTLSPLCPLATRQLELFCPLLIEL